jgi:HEPN domain-containing protein
MTNGNPQEWLAHAESDLRLAQLARADADVLPNQMAFHAQQCVEKALKAVLVDATVDFPKTHDLKELILLIQASGRAWPEELNEARTLTGFAVEARYPGYVEQCSLNAVDGAIALAARVLAWAKGQVKLSAANDE